MSIEEINDVINQSKGIIDLSVGSAEACLESLEAIKCSLSEIDFPDEPVENFTNTLQESLDGCLQDYLAYFDVESIDLDLWVEEVATKASECVMAHVEDCIQKTEGLNDGHTRLLQHVVQLSSLKRALDDNIRRWPGYMKAYAEKTMAGIMGDGGLEDKLLSTAVLGEQTINEFNSSVNARLNKITMNTEQDISDCFLGLASQIRESFVEAVEKPFQDLVSDVPIEFAQAVVESIGITQIAASINTSLAPYAPQIALAKAIADEVSDALEMDG